MMRRFVVPIAVVSILILLGGLTAGLVSAIGPTPPPPTPTAIPPDETVTQTSASDRAALVALYNATDGPNWSKNTNWLGNAPLGEWYGVFTDGNGRVVGLKLYGSGLSGTIPSELGSLTHLGTLVLAGNRLNGEIPAELGGLANLQELSLHGNLLSGGIPSELGRLINLRALYLSSNQLSGEIPPELGDLTNVQGLLLHTNQLSGEIPSELGNLANLQGLLLHSNQLSGEIPPELGDLTNVQGLLLHTNQLSGEIPSELGNLANLQSLWLYSNQLSGEIPEELGDLTNVQGLLLHTNQLSGEIPSELGNLANLQSLWLYSNQLSGEIPEELGNLANLGKLYLYNNQLNGEIPSELGGLANLKSLDLSSNQLSGEIPPELGDLTNVQGLLLHTNQLSGEIPSELGNLANLQSLWLSGNPLKGCIPQSLKNVGSNDLAELSLPFCGAPGTSTAPTPPSPTPTPPPDGGDDGDSLGNRVTDVKVEATPNTPNSVAKWTVQFINGTAGSNDGALDGGTGKDTIKIEFEDDVQFPAAISQNDVTITTSMVWDSNKAETRTLVANPLGVDIIKVSEFEGSAQKTDKPPDETLVTLEVPDMEPADDQPGSQGIAAGALVTVVFRQTAGIKNPTESKPDQVNQAQRAAAVDLNGNFDASLLKPLSGYKVQVATSNSGYFVPAAPAHRAVIPRRIVMSDQDGPRGSTITVVGLGFRNSLTAVVWNDKNRNGARDGGEIDLGYALVTGSDDFITTITVNNPPFSQGLNTNGINAVDGRNRTIIPGRRYTGAFTGATFMERIPQYKLESSIKVTPGIAAIGDTVQVAARDFVAGGTISTSTARISIGGVPVTDFESTSVSSTGDATFEMTIPNGAASGTQNLVVRDGPNALFDPTHDIVNTGGARFNMVISGAQLSVTPSTGLVPNQTVTLVGRGFSTGGAALINVDGSDATISGDDTDLGARSEKFNEGDAIEVDNAGNWSSSFVIPITHVTTTPGNHELSITDTGGRSGSVNLNMAERQLTLSPPSGRVGTRVDLEGSGFPADNPGEGGDRTVTVEIQYSVTGDIRTVVTLTPDGSGNISGWFTVPLNAGIPSTNAVRAIFDIPTSGVNVTTSAVHQVPRAGITLDQESGPAGTVVTINGEGFKRYTTVSEINFGTLDVRSGTSLSTDSEGAFETTFLAPVSNTGAQAVTVRVGETIASATFTVTAALTIITSPIIAGPNSLTVTWAAPANTGGSIVTAYDLRYIRTDADETVEANWTLVEDVWTIGFNPLEYVLTGLTAGTQYDVQLRAVNAAGTGPWSATATGTPSTWGAIRSLSETYVEPGGEVMATITATGYGLYGHVVETLPPGFSYTHSDLNEDAVIVSGREVIVFLLRGEERFTYTVTAPGAARERPPTPTPTSASRAAREYLPTPTPTPRRRRVGEYPFFGDLVNENRLQQTVGGAASIRVGVEPLVYAINNAATLVRIDSPIPVTVTFGEPVFGFTLDDVSVSNGIAGGFTSSDGSPVYAFDVTPNEIGKVTVDIAADVAMDSNGNGNTASLQLSLGIPYDDDHDGGISKEEAITAVIDYFAERITKAEAIAIIILYFSS